MLAFFEVKRKSSQSQAKAIANPSVTQAPIDFDRFIEAIRR
ncbi:hypothetical protein [Microseira sp. BLCC-F43]